MGSRQEVIGHLYLFSGYTVSKWPWTSARSASGHGRQPWSPWIFIHDTDKLEGGLMVLFLVLFFPLPFPPEFFCRRPCKWQHSKYFVVYRLNRISK